MKGKGLFTLLKIMVSILKKERKVETRGYIKLGVMELKIKKTNPNFLQMNKLYRVSPHEVLWS